MYLGLLELLLQPPIIPFFISLGSLLWDVQSLAEVFCSFPSCRHLCLFHFPCCSSCSRVRRLIGSSFFIRRLINNFSPCWQSPGLKRQRLAIEQCHHLPLVLQDTDEAKHRRLPLGECLRRLLRQPLCHVQALRRLKVRMGGWKGNHGWLPWIHCFCLGTAPPTDTTWCCRLPSYLQTRCPRRYPM